MTTIPPPDDPDPAPPGPAPADETAPYRILYRLRLEDGTQRALALELDPRTLEQRDRPSGRLPPWTVLSFHQCANCPLDGSRHRHCPLAASLVGVVALSRDLPSYEPVGLTVVTPERTISADTTVQRAVSSVLGLTIATSPCPHTRFFRPMARFHLPLATEEETVYRATSMYLLAQYFLQQRGAAADFALDGLRAIYADIQLINHALAARLRAADEKDGAVNAVVVLDLFAKALPAVIDDSLAELRYLFAPYFDDDDAGMP